MLGRVLQSSKKVMAQQATFKPKIVFVLGGPGSGKGTQCANICRDYGYVHLSAGDLLREERRTPESQFGELIESHIRNGTIVPVEITCSLIEKAIERVIKTQKTSGDEPGRGGRFLIDGFPRNKNNLEGWERLMAEKVDLQFVLFLACSEDECVKRCLLRGASGSGRSDDNEESLRKRMKTYSFDTMPIVKYYDKLNVVRSVDALQTPEQVYKDIKKLFSDLS